MHDEMQPQEPMNTMPDGQVDQEGAMAKADLYKLATYSLKLFKKIDDNAQLESWVQAKITKAADYVASVYHYLEYELKFSEYGHQLDNSDVLSEDQKTELKNKLMEAKAIVKKLKVDQAEKLSKKEKKVDEGMFGGEEKTCEACGGTGHVMTPERQVPEATKAKVAKYNRQAKAMHAASKRIDKNKNGIPDDEELGEEQGELKKTGDTKKTRTGTLTKTDTGVIHKNTSYHDDGDEISANAKSGKGIKSHAKSQSAAEKKEKAPKLKQSPKSAKTWGMKDSEKFDNRDKAVDETYGQGVYEGKGKKPDFLDMDKDGDKKEPMKKAVADKKKNPFAKKDGKVEEALKGGQKKLDVDKDGDIEADDLADLRAKKDSKAKIKEAISRAKQLNEGPFDTLGAAASKVGTALGFDTEENLAKKSPQLQQLIALRKDPKYQSPEAKSALEARITKQKDRVSLDKGEVMDKDGMTPVAVNESTDLDRVKQFLTRLNG